MRFVLTTRVQRRTHDSIRTFVVLAGVLTSVCGCGSTGDQTAVRRKEMQYTLDNLTDEVASRIKECDRRAAEMSRKMNSESASSADADDGSDRSDGPGGNPFTIERIGEDVAVKLTRLSEGGEDPETVVDELARKLKSKGVEGDKIEKLVAAIREFQADLPPNGKVVHEVGGR